MKDFKIQRIYLENFKHISLLERDFTDKDFIVLDGPNGFGKTTLFDAIELTISGKISRVINTDDGRLGYEDLLFSNNKDKDTVIKIEFADSLGHAFTIVKKFESQKNWRPIDRKPDNWSLFDTYVLENFNSEIDNTKIVSPDELNEKLNLRNLNRYFSLFYYVQQEENTYFLRKLSKDRMNELSQLFDTKKEELELGKFNKIKKILENEKRLLLGNNGPIITKRNAIESITVGIQDIKQESLENTEYSPLIPGTDLKEWDREDFSIQKEKRDKYLEDLRGIYKLVRDIDDYLNKEANEKLQGYILNKELLQNVIISAQFLETYKNIRELNSKELIIREIKKKINLDYVKDNLDKFPIIELEGLNESSFQLEMIKEKLSILKKYKKEMGQISSLVKDVNDTRNLLIKNLEELNKNNLVDSNKDCPLCGYSWNSYEELLKNLELKGKSFQSHYDNSTQKFELEFEALYKYLKPIQLWIEDYLNDKENLIDNNFYKQLSQSMSRKNQVIEFLKWCEENKINLSSFTNSNKEEVLDIENRYIEITRYLESLLNDVSSEYKEHEEKKNIFNSIFNKNIATVRKIQLEHITKKAKYIDYKYYNGSTQTIDSLRKEIQKLESRVLNINNSLIKLQEIINVYEERILKHWKKIIRDIEIPFFIYSGKILQDYQRGCGIFIQESESYGQKSIKFVSNYRLNHDAVNYLSSGQLSGLVIAFTLALNKIYGNNAIDLILIDDPVQSMDEINMASFVELLRNDFKDKQIILSTHEEDISRYMRYKFAKYNLNTLRLNLKETLYAETYEE